MVRSIAAALLLTVAGTPAMLASASPAASLVSVAGASEEPTVFSTAGLEADRRQAADENRVHVVYATATWCPPCKRMKTTTWVDEDVVEWLGANAVVTPLDVDQFQSDASRLRVRAMPTIMLFNGSAEITRTVGYQAPGAFREWLESSTGRGLTSGDAEAAAPASRESVQDTLVGAQAAANAGRLDEAAEAYAWLWDNMQKDAPGNAVRRGSLAQQIGSLIEQHDAAREPFAERRNSIGTQMPPANADDQALLDWVVLNGLLEDDRLTTAWVGSVIDDRKILTLLRRHQRLIRPVLTDQGMWRDAATVVNNPFAAARVEIMELKKAQRASGDTGIDPATLDSLADLYVIGLTIDRGGFAERVSDLVLRTEDTPAVRRALVARAIEADITRPSLADLLADDGSDEAQALRAQLDG